MYLGLVELLAVLLDQGDELLLGLPLLAIELFAGGSALVRGGDRLIEIDDTDRELVVRRTEPPTDQRDCHCHDEGPVCPGLGLHADCS